MVERRDARQGTAMAAELAGHRPDWVERAKRWLVRGPIGAASAAALVAAGAFLVGGIGEIEHRIFATILRPVGAALTALAAAGQVGYASVLAKIGVGASAVWLALALALVWAPWDGDAGEAVWRVAAVAGVVAVSAAHAALLLPRRRGHVDRAGIAVVLRLTLILSGLISLLLIGLVLSEDAWSIGAVRLLGALTVLAAPGTLLVPVLRFADAAGARTGGGRDRGEVGAVDGGAA